MMLNVTCPEPLTSSELFLLMRLLSHLDRTEGLPQDQETLIDWQTIYSKLVYQARIAREMKQARLARETT